MTCEETGPSTTTPSQAAPKPDLTVEEVAKRCHEANRAYCWAIDDYTAVPWGDAPEWQKQSAINGVEFHLGHPYADPAASHENWLKLKLAEGWTYGTVKDPEKKTHPCCVPYSVLPPSQKIKDYIFCGVVDALRSRVKPKETTR